MNACSDTNALLSDPNTEPSMNYSWILHGNFLGPTKDVSDTPPGDALEKGKSEAKPTKRSNRAPKKKVQKPKKKDKKPKSADIHEKKGRDYDLEAAALDFSAVPSPVCSCTGVPRQCYRWGAGGWQSSCCTTTVSAHPLPMSSSRPGSRTAGRKMSIGAYGKLLQRLRAEGHDLSVAVDLKDHWARHGTNKFVTIR